MCAGFAGSRRDTGRSALRRGYARGLDNNAPHAGRRPSCGKVSSSVRCFDPQRLKWKSKIPLDDLAEGYAVDDDRGLFYTNIEEPGKTVAIDVRSHKIVAEWNPGSSD